jgi:hypothetical protein
MKKIYVGLIFVVIVAMGSYWWNQKSNLSLKDIPPASTPDMSDVGAVQSFDEPVAVEEDRNEATNRFAKSIAFVPDNNRESSESTREFDFDLQDSVKQMVESALTGNVEVSVNLGQLVNRCSERRSEEQVLLHLQIVSQTFSPKTQFGLINGEHRKFDTFEAYENFIWNDYDQCRVIKTIFEDDLHKRIIQMADDGHAIARYLYAMWRPPSGPNPDTGNIMEWLEYQEKAFAYSLQNMDEGQPLGLLAFGQSVRNITPGFFTPPNFNFAETYFLAAKKCGLNIAWLDSQIGEFRARLSGDRGQIRLQQIENSANDLKEIFCG